MPTIQELLPEAHFAPPHAGAQVTALPEQHRRYRYFSRKYQIERVIGIGLLIPALPVIAICWAAVRLTSKGPGLYRQTRVGYRGQPFEVIKLRTMRIDAEANGPQWSSKGDPRITRLGRALRTLHLDELPQLINVARGEMVLVGPRPERPEFVELLTDHVPGYKRRLIVKPGITGLSQINLPPDTDLRSVERKQILDLHHIDHAHSWFDMRMIMLTALRVISISNTRLTRLMKLDHHHLLAEFPVENMDRKTVTLQELLNETQRQKEWELGGVGGWESKDSEDEDWQDDAYSVQQPR